MDGFYFNQKYEQSEPGGFENSFVLWFFLIILETERYKCLIFSIDL